MKGFLDNYFNIDKLQGRLISHEAYEASWNLATTASAIAAVACIAAWETDFRGDLAGIDVPMLAIHGTDDNVVPLAKSTGRLAGTIKDLQVVEIDDGPHAIPWTHADDVNNALRKFLG
jgi:non-heme chloroperoxidase